MPRALIVGADSQIGSALADALPKIGWSVTPTSRREDAADFLQLDLSRPVSDWPDIPAVDAAVICAAVTSQQACEDDPAGSGRVNTEHAAALARKLHDAGAFALLLSTVAVFDGSRPHRTHDEAAAPANAYGRQKAAAEEAVLSAGTAAVLRLSKVMGPDMPLLKQWLADLRAGKPVTAFGDVTIAPVSLAFVTALIEKILRARRPGVYHASGDRDLPYTDLAVMMCDALGAPREQCRTSAAGGEAAGKHTTLDMSLERRLFGIEQPSSEETIRATLQSVI